MQRNMKRLLSLLTVFALALTTVLAGAVNADATSDILSLTVDGNAAEAVSAGTETCPVDGTEAEVYTVSVAETAKNLIVSLNGSEVLTDVYADLDDVEDTYIEVTDGAATIDLVERYVYLCLISEGGNLYHLYLTYDGEAEEPGTEEEPATVPFAAAVNGTEITDIVEDTVTWTDWSGTASDVTRYTVAVPQGTTEATLTFESDMQVAYYSSTGEWLAYVNDDASMTAATEHTIPLQDANGDGELDGISVQIPDSYATDYYVQFVYAAAGSEEETACLTILADAPTSGTTTAGALYEL